MAINTQKTREIIKATLDKTYDANKTFSGKTTD